MEIEKKFLVSKLPEDLDQWEASVIEQGYLCTDPVIRIRKMDDQYILTYKSKRGVQKAAGVCINQEEELPLTKESYQHLKDKIDGVLIEKTRYRMCYPSGSGRYKIELDVFHGHYEGMVLAEVEFPSKEEADQFIPPEWFAENVSDDFHYSNAFLSENGTRPLKPGACDETEREA